MVSITDVAKVLQRAEMFARVEEELSKYISELRLGRPADSDAGGRADCQRRQR